MLVIPLVKHKATFRTSEHGHSGLFSPFCTYWNVWLPRMLHNHVLQQRICPGRAPLLSHLAYCSNHDDLRRCRACIHHVSSLHPQATRQHESSLEAAELGVATRLTAAPYTNCPPVLSTKLVIYCCTVDSNTTLHTACAPFLLLTGF